MRRVQPGRRRVDSADGPARRVSDRTTASAGAGACSAVHRPSRRAEAEALEPTLAHTRCPQPLHRSAGARREGGRPARVVVADSAASPARARPQLPRHRSPLTTVRAAAPSIQPCARSLNWFHTSSTRPTSLLAQQPPFPWLCRWLVGAARHGAAGRVAPPGCAFGPPMLAAGDTRLPPPGRRAAPCLSTHR